MLVKCMALHLVSKYYSHLCTVELVSARDTVVTPSVGALLNKNALLFHVFFSANRAHLWTPGLGNKPARWMACVVLLLYELDAKNTNERRHTRSAMCTRKTNIITLFEKNNSNWKLQDCPQKQELKQVSQIAAKVLGKAWMRSKNMMVLPHSPLQRIVDNPEFRSLQWKFLTPLKVGSVRFLDLIERTIVILWTVHRNIWSIIQRAILSN